VRLSSAEDLNGDETREWLNLPLDAASAVEEAAQLVHAVDVPDTKAAPSNPFDWVTLDRNDLHDFVEPMKGALLEAERATEARRKPPPPPLAPKPRT
jgi:hypothetical protein